MENQYFAGLVDAVGSLHISEQRKRDNVFHNIELTLRHTNVRVLREAADDFGGIVCGNKLRISGQQLRRIIPILKTLCQDRVRRFELAEQFFATYDKSGPECRAHRMRLKAHMQLAQLSQDTSSNGE